MSPPPTHPLHSYSNSNNYGILVHNKNSQNGGDFSEEIKKIRCGYVIWFLQHLKQLGIYLHVFVSTQGTQVVLGVLTEESEEKEAELHEQDEVWRACEFLTYFYIFSKQCLLYLRATFKIGTKLYLYRVFLLIILVF